MNILVITESIDNTAAGSIFNNFIKELHQYNKIKLLIITNDIEGALGNKYNTIQLKKSPLKNSRFYKLALTALNFDLEGYSRVKSGESAFKSAYKKFKPDVILVFAAGFHYYTLELGNILSRKYKVPLAVHLVDPMPAVEGWNEHRLLRNAIIKYVSKRLRYAKLLSYTNQKMLDYQIALHKISKNTITEVLYNPAQYSPLSNQFSNKHSKFVYIGALYNKRQPNELIEAFVNYLSKDPDAELLFVGSINNYDHLIPKEFSDKISFLEWTNSPEQYLEYADVLIDIDADIANDVFISSKLNNYLMYDKPILAISPENSPARELLKMCKATIFFTVNSSHSIFEKLIEINNLETSKELFSEREKLRSELQIESLTSKLMSGLKKLTEPDNIR